MNDPQIYHFTKGDWGEQYTVMAFSEEDALQFVKDYLKGWSDEEAAENPHTRHDGSQYDSDFHKSEYEKWKDATVDNLPKDGDHEWFIYGIESYSLGSVLETYKG